jgi:hypothetical protein
MTTISVLYDLSKVLLQIEKGYALIGKLKY